jgi:hypothetical protein
METHARERLAAMLEVPAAKACSDAVDIADLCIFMQQRAGEPFSLARRCPLDG